MYEDLIIGMMYIITTSTGQSVRAAFVKRDGSRLLFESKLPSATYELDESEIVTLASMPNVVS